MPKDEAITIERRQLQAKYNKHAGDFGVDGSWSPENGRRFEQAIRQHVASEETKVSSGTYRGYPVLHYVSEKTGLIVIATRKGAHISGWKLNPKQLENVLTRRSL